MSELKSLGRGILKPDVVVPIILNMQYLILVEAVLQRLSHEIGSGIEAQQQNLPVPGMVPCSTNNWAGQPIVECDLPALAIRQKVGQREEFRLPSYWGDKEKLRSFVKIPEARRAPRTQKRTAKEREPSVTSSDPAKVEMGPASFCLQLCQSVIMTMAVF